VQTVTAAGAARRSRRPGVVHLRRAKQAGCSRKGLVEWRGRSSLSPRAVVDDSAATTRGTQYGVVWRAWRRQSEGGASLGQARDRRDDDALASNAPLDRRRAAKLTAGIILPIDLSAVNRPASDRAP